MEFASVIRLVSMLALLDSMPDSSQPDVLFQFCQWDNVQLLPSIPMVYITSLHDGYSWSSLAL